ncbi:hypothetical protein LCGC14_0887120 [marine sediment metagenome]|uniref:Uncharacterized protein n=1 Tax=marine sediment metagenome TaxID=412755 RepID=A0A0F9RJM2_9ZZZZ
MEHIKRFLTGFALLSFCFGAAFGLAWLLEYHAIYFLSVLGLVLTYGVGFVVRKII